MKFLEPKKTREELFHEDVHRGKAAKDLLDNPLLTEAFTAIREQLQAEWLASPARDAEGREKLWLMTAMLKKLETHITQHIQTGENAATLIKEDEKKRKLFSLPKNF